MAMIFWYIFTGTRPFEGVQPDLVAELTSRVTTPPTHTHARTHAHARKHTHTSPVLLCLGTPPPSTPPPPPFGSLRAPRMARARSARGREVGGGGWRWGGR